MPSRRPSRARPGDACPGIPALLSHLQARYCPTWRLAWCVDEMNSSRAAMLCVLAYAYTSSVSTWGL
jgi:hypothetical protein